MARSPESLLYDVCQEMYFQFAKIQPYLAGFRQQMNLPEWMSNIEKVIQSSAGGISRLENMRENLEQVRKLRASPESK